MRHLIKVKDVDVGILWWSTTRPTYGRTPGRISRRLQMEERLKCFSSKPGWNLTWFFSPGGVSGRWVGDILEGSDPCSGKRQTPPAGRWKRNLPVSCNSKKVKYEYFELGKLVWALPDVHFHWSGAAFTGALCSCCCCLPLLSCGQWKCASHLLDQFLYCNICLVFPNYVQLQFLNEFG